MKKMDTRKKLKQVPLTSTQAESLHARRARVHAQRKFAHPNGVVPSPTKEYKDLREKLNSNHQQKVKSGLAVTNVKNVTEPERPKTEDFLTFLCFRGTALLPQDLEHFEIPNYNDADSQGHSLHREDKPPKCVRRRLEEPILAKPTPALTKESAKRNIINEDEAQTTPKSRVTRSSASLIPSPSFMSSSSVDSSPEVKSRNLLKRKQMLLKKAMIMKKKNKMAHQRQNKLKLRGKVKTEPSRVTRSKIDPCEPSIMACRKTVKSSLASNKKDNVCRMLKRLGGTLVEHEPKSLTKTRSNKISPEITIKVESSPPPRKSKTESKSVSPKTAELKIKSEPADTGYDLFDNSIQTKKIPDAFTRRRASSRLCTGIDSKSNRGTSPSPISNEPQVSSSNEGDESSPPQANSSNKNKSNSELPSASSSPRPSRKTKKVAEAFMQIVSQKLAKEERNSKSQDVCDSEDEMLIRDIKFIDNEGGKTSMKKITEKAVPSIIDKRELRSQSSVDRKESGSPQRRKSSPIRPVTPVEKAISPSNNTRITRLSSPQRSPSPKKHGPNPLKSPPRVSCLATITSPKESLRNFKFQKNTSSNSSSVSAKPTQKTLQVPSVKIKRTNSLDSSPCTSPNKTKSLSMESLPQVATTSVNLTPTKSEQGVLKLSQKSKAIRRNSDEPSLLKNVHKPITRRKSQNSSTINTEVGKINNCFESSSSSPKLELLSSSDKILKSSRPVPTTKSVKIVNEVQSSNEDSSSATSSPIALKKSSGNTGKKLIDVVKNLQQKQMAEGKIIHKGIKQSKKTEALPTSKQVSAEAKLVCITAQAPAVHTMAANTTPEHSTAPRLDTIPLASHLLIPNVPKQNSDGDSASPAVSSAAVATVTITPTKLSIPKVTKLPQGALLQVPSLAGIKSPITLLAPGLTLHKNASLSSSNNILTQQTNYPSVSFHSPPTTSIQQPTSTKPDLPIKAKQILIAPKPSKHPQLQSKNISVPLIPSGQQKHFAKQISIAPKVSSSTSLCSNTQSTAPMIAGQSMGHIMPALSRNLALTQGVHNVQTLPQAVQSLQALGHNFPTISGVTQAIQGVMPQTMALNHLGTPSSPAKIITQPVFVSSHLPNVMATQFDLSNSLQSGINQMKSAGSMMTPVTAPLVTLGSVSTGGSLIPSFLPLNQPGQQPQFLTVNMMPVGPSQLSVGNQSAHGASFRPVLCSQNMQCLRAVPTNVVTSLSDVNSLMSSASPLSSKEPLSSQSSVETSAATDALRNVQFQISEPEKVLQTELSNTISIDTECEKVILATPTVENEGEKTSGQLAHISSPVSSSGPTIAVEPSPALSLVLSKLYPLNQTDSANISKEQVTSPTINTHLYTTSIVGLPEIADHATSRPKAFTQVSQSSPPYLLSTTTSEQKKAESEKPINHIQSANSPIAPSRKVKRDPVKRLNLEPSNAVKLNAGILKNPYTEIEKQLNNIHGSEGKKSIETPKPASENGQVATQQKTDAKLSNGSSDNSSNEKRDQAHRRTLFKTKNKKDLKASDAFSVLNESSVYAFEPDFEPQLEMTKPFSSRAKKVPKKSEQPLAIPDPLPKDTLQSKLTTPPPAPLAEKRKLDRPKPKKAMSSEEVEALMKLGASSCSSAEDETGDEEESPLEIVSMTPVYSIPTPSKPISPKKTPSSPKKLGSAKSTTTKFVPKFGGRIPTSQNSKRKTVLRVPVRKSTEKRPLPSTHSASLASISSSLSLMTNSQTQSSNSKQAPKTFIGTNSKFHQSDMGKPAQCVDKIPKTKNSKQTTDKNPTVPKLLSSESDDQLPPTKKAKTIKSPVASASIAIQCDLEETLEDNNKANESGTQTENPSKYPLPPSASPFYYLPLAMATLGEKLPAQLVQQMLAKTQGLVGVTEAGMILQQAAQLAQQYHKNSEQTPPALRPSTVKPISPKSGGLALQEALKASLSTTQLLASGLSNENSPGEEEQPEAASTVEEVPATLKKDSSAGSSCKPLTDVGDTGNNKLKRKSNEAQKTPCKKKQKVDETPKEVIKKTVNKSKGGEPVAKRRSGRSSTSASTKATEFDMHEAVEIKRNRRARRAAVALSKDDGWSSSSETPVSPTMSPDSFRGWPSSRLTSPTPSLSSEGTTSSTPSYRSRFSNQHSRRQSPARGIDVKRLSRSSSLQQFPTDPVIEPRVVKVKENEKLTRAPSFFPSEEEFNEPLDYIEKIRPEAEQFGVCRIVPPSSFKPDCSVNDDMRFTVYQQYINRVMNRWGHNVKILSAIRKCLLKQNIELSGSPLIGGVELDLVHLYEIVEELGGLMAVIENQLWARVADMLRIPRFAQDRLTKLDSLYCKYLLPYAMLSEEERQTILEEVTLQAEKKATTKSVVSSMGSDEDSEEEEEPFEFVTKGKSTSLSAFYRVSRNIASQWQPDPDDMDLDERYWSIVKERDRHVCVHSASIDTTEHGYGFPCNKNSPSSKHPWNLKNICQNPTSILRSMQDVIGVSAPTLHIGMTFSTVCWYRDPHSLPWLEYLHTGACKIWYGVASTQEEKMRSALKKLVPDFVKDSPVWLPSDTTMVPPELLVDEGIRVCRIVQEPGQFVVVFPGAFTSSVCSGYLISESAFYAKPQYFDRAVQSFKMLRECCEPAMFSLDRLALSVASDSKASLDSLLTARSYVAHLVEKEKKQRLLLKDIGIRTTERFGHQTSQKKKGRYVEEEETLCDTCGQHLYVSSVLSPEDDCTYCLEHATKLLTEKPRQLDDWKILYSYSVSELASTLKTMDDRISQKSVKHASLKRVMNERQDSFSSNSSSTC